ncbi:MAG: ketohydroxyglutarate aldolase [Gammaproteobacteria bacterium]|nr:MAG: ketohydroxyglutarate aldolase [Gammaproteobacteria bacterium]
MSAELRELLKRCPILPVIVIEDAAAAVPLARALVEAGLVNLEITLRTAAAFDAIARIAGEVEGAVVGAGTVVDAAQLRRAVAAGARFLVSPGLSPRLAEAAAEAGVPWLPGVQTAGELMHGLEHGLDTFKFFPAEPAGGVAMLKAFHGPFPQLRFCPTGGIAGHNAPAYLALPNVLCVGGSWVVPADRLATGDYAAVTAQARAALAALAG